MSATPRWITAAEYYSADRGDVRVVDLGIVTVRDAAIYGRLRPLLPYKAGQLISSVRFIPTAIPADGTTMWFMTPNTTNFSGFGYLDGNNLNQSQDTLGIVVQSNATGIDGAAGSPKSQILDCGPLIAGTNNPISEFTGLQAWQPDTPYCINDSILDSNDNIQTVSVNGVSGGSEPTWATVLNDPTTDNSVIWTNSGPVGTGEVHAVAEIIEGISIMPPYPASIEFVAAPADVVAGETMADITVIVKDQNGDPYKFTTQVVSVKIYGAGTLVGTDSAFTDITTGIATISGLSITEPGTGYIMRANNYPQIQVENIFSPPFDVTAP